MHSAAWQGHLAVARLLIDRGANINALMENGKTPLDVAIEQGHGKVAKLIRDRGGIQGTQEMP